MLQISPAVMPKIETEHHTEDSMDFSPPAMGSEGSATPVVSTPAAVSSVQSTPAPKKAKTPGKKLVTGYILYSSEVRKSVAEKNPDKGFGEISRMVGTDVSAKVQTEYLKEIYCLPKSKFVHDLLVLFMHSVAKNGHRRQAKIRRAGWKN